MMPKWKDFLNKNGKTDRQSKHNNSEFGGEQKKSICPCFIKYKENKYKIGGNRLWVI